jgi:hypothetical protein
LSFHVFQETGFSHSLNRRGIGNSKDKKKKKGKRNNKLHRHCPKADSSNRSSKSSGSSLSYNGKGEQLRRLTSKSKYKISALGKKVNAKGITSFLNTSNQNFLKFFIQ